MQLKPDVDAPWIDLPGDIIAASTTASKTATNGLPQSQGFYRVLVVP